MKRVTEPHEIITWYIYKIVSPSNRVYIGKTYNLKGRQNNYRSHNVHKQRLLQASLEKYGFGNHTFEIIDQFDSDLSCANSKEMFWIRTCMSNKVKYPEQNGLNLTDGGEGTKGKRANPNIRKGKPQWSDENKERIGLSKIGNTYMSGKNHSDVSKNKIAATRFERYGKPVIQYDLKGNYIKEHTGVKQASRDTGVNRTTISRSAKGISKRPEKFTFKYKNYLGFEQATFQRRVFKLQDIKEKIA